MAQKIASSLVASALILSQTSPVFAQIIDTTAPTTAPAPVEEIITPPADTTGPAFISVATASAEETEVNVVWTTDELAYGFVEYGETTSYGLATPKSASAALDHTASVTGLAPGTAYHYRIVAEDESGNISYSKDRTFETALEIVAIDNVPPEISEISATNVTVSGATISWITNELAQGKVEYGKTAEYGASSPLATDYVTEHSATLYNLDPDTEYHYRVVVQDESSNEAFSPDEIFITDPAPVTAPIEEPATSTPPTPTTTATTTVFAISHVETSLVGTSTATIIWQTNELANAQVFYGPGEAYASSSLLSATNATSHEIKLTGLKSGTNYFYKVVSKNASGQIVSQSGFEFNTLFEQKITVAPPTISNMKIESIGPSTAVILFNTNMPASGKVNYGTTTSYEKTDGGHAVFLINHSHPLSGLTPNTSYNFVAIVRDANGNETIYENKTFKTLEDSSVAAPQSTPAVGSAAESQETVTDQTTVAPARSAGTGGGDYSYTRTTTLAAPQLTKVEALDGQVMFLWNSQKPPKITTPGSTKILTNVIIVRNPVAHPTGPTFGKIVYKGNSGLFTDANLENGKTYYYSVFVANQFNSYSPPTRFKVTPTKADEEIELEVVPPVVQKNPIYSFPKTLKLKVGDKNKHVEHLQVLLASEPSLHPKGLITGYFGPLTKEAVKAFQKRYELTVTGVADSATLKKLEKLSSVEIVSDRATLFDAALSRDLKVGLSGGDVSILQQFLINTGVYPKALVSGYFGSLTKSALQRFQKDQNITPSNGYFGPVTKKRALNLIRLRSVSF